MTTERIIPDKHSHEVRFFQVPGKIDPFISTISLYYLCAMLIKPTLIKAAEAAGKVLQQYYGSHFQISNKEGINNLVTEANHAA